MRRGDGSIATETLKALMIRGIETKDSVGEINEEFARDRKEAIEQHGLHARAFSLCLTLKRMDQVKRTAFLAAFDSYRHILDLDDETQIEAFPQQPQQLRAVR